jgi:cell division protease FtsH
VLVGDNEQEVFLGQQLTSRRVVSERTAQQVDDEVARVIDTAFQRAKKVITENRPLLDAIAASLLERETLTREDFAILIKGDKLPPRPPSAIAPVTPAAPAVVEPKRVNPPLLGGPEPSPA